MRDILAATGLPVSRGKTDIPTDPPYLIYVDEAPTQTAADNRVLFSQRHVRIEYYWITKSSDTEALIESALSDFYWTKSEDIYIETENMWVTYYYI